MGFSGSMSDIEILNRVFTELPSDNAKSYQRYASSVLKATQVATPDITYALLNDLIILSGYVVKTEGIIHNNKKDRILYVRVNNLNDRVFNRLGCEFLGNELYKNEMTKKYVESSVIRAMKSICIAGKIRVGQIMVQAQKMANVINNKNELRLIVTDLTKMAKCMGRVPLERSKDYSRVLGYLKDRCPEPELRLILARAEDAYKCLEPEIMMIGYVGASESQIYKLLGINTIFADVGKSVKGVIIKKDEFNKVLSRLGKKLLNYIDVISLKYGLNDTQNVEGNQ